MHGKRRRGMRGARCRWHTEGRWHVRARIERFVEPSLLLLLAERPMHGYDLLERVSGLTGQDGGVDLGNLYRVLRALELDGLVSSKWDSKLSGPAKRVYDLTDGGREVLGLWVEALGAARGEIAAFLERYEALGRR